MDESSKNAIASVISPRERAHHARRGLALGVRSFPILVALALCACKDSKKCDDALTTARKAVELNDFSSARNWREHTWKMCADRAMLDALDKDILAAEAAALSKLEEAAKLAQQQAQVQINEAQKLWLKYDAFEASDKTRNNLDKLLTRAQALGQGLEPEHKAQFEAYNIKEHARRAGALVTP